MPTYTYECPRCHQRQERVRPIAARNAPVLCGCLGRGVTHCRRVVEAPFTHVRNPAVPRSRPR
jgi:putative FmdB family regulatory protein